jgi:CIC family chloride channel protein
MPPTAPLAALIRPWQHIRRNDQVWLWFYAVVVGAAAGYGAIAFRLAIGAVQEIAYGFSDERVHSLAAALPWWHVMVAPALGGLVVAVIVRVAMPQRQPESIGQVIEAAALSDGRMTLRQGLGAAVVSATSLGVGASAGREGPVVHLGAALGSVFAQWLRLNRSLTLTLVGCGVASATAASFNAPIAGVFFALEVVLGHYALSAFAPVVIASVIGTVICRVHIGDYPAFTIPDYAIASLWELPAFALLGLVSAGVAIAFMWGIFFAEDTSLALARRLAVPAWLRPAGGGLLVGAIAIYFPHVLGVGYEATDDALNGEYALWLLIALIVAKTAATAISLGAGFGGGVFSPALYVGAMTGGAFGIVAAAAVPVMAANEGLYAIVGMGAVTASVMGAPITTILIVFELTGDYRLTVAVMVAVAIAGLVTRQTLGRSIFGWQLARRGLDIAGGREHHILRRRRVGELASDRYHVLAAEAGPAAISEALAAARFPDFLVIDADGRLVGLVGFAELRAATGGEGAAATAGELAQDGRLVLAAGDDLDTALGRMEAAMAETVAVVADHADRRPIGVLQQKDLLIAYNRALLQARAEERGEATRH